ncbi:hypothetical protein NUSPORA_01128 [Nucleospora cyclopteri]
MVHCKKCVLIQTDSSIKEIVCKIAEEEKTLLFDMDDNNVFLTEKGSVNIQIKVKKLLESKKIQDEH